MHTFAIRTAVALLMATVLMLSQSEAAKTQFTRVYVKDMHCNSCAKKIAGKLYAVPGVVSVKTNYKKGLAIVTPQKSKTPSPKALWEAVESATFQPVKIASPLGIYTQKPKR
ncbi:MAG: heavy metal-associated domain-containing protein [Pirellulaceae bacterium]|nr:heavy metal-associated domain-containing protein [Pirellulaceae bacterium]